jgi:uncharacterized repeat protein (TIGR02543 family)
VGYSFEGFSRPAGYDDGSGMITDNPFTFTLDKTIVLVAQWKPNAYTITLSLEDGTANTISHPVTYAAAVGELPTPERSGYTFGAWYTQPNGGGTQYSSTTVYRTPSNATLYAQWDSVKYEITLLGNGGYIGANSLDDTAHTVTYKGKVGALPAPHRKGYRFVEWNASSTGLGKTYAKDTVYSTAGSIKLYAIWEMITYTITYENLLGGANDVRNPATYTANSGEITLYPATKAGYKFANWRYATANGREATAIAAGDTGCITLYATWDETALTKYKITYELNGGANSTNPANRDTFTVADTVTLHPATKPGHKFEGWYNAYNFSGSAVTGISKGTTGDKMFFAKWMIDTFRVAFSTDGGSPVDTQKVAYGGAVARPENPTKAGYTFDKWYEDAACATPWNFGDGTATQNTTLYARWTANRYTLAFDADSGSVSPPSKAVTYGDTVGALPTPLRTGYSFKGWFTENNAAGTLYAKDSVYRVAGSATLYACWAKNCHTVTFSFNDGTGRTESQSLRYGDTVSRPVDPTREGYRFSGWCRDSAGGLLWSFSTDRVSGNDTLYACWIDFFKLTSITVNGDTVTVDSSTFYCPVSCGDTTSTLRIAFNLPNNVKSSIGSTFTWNGFPARLDTVFTLSYHGAPSEQTTYRLRLEKPLAFDSIVHRQLGDRLLMVVNDSTHNGGYRFQTALWRIDNNGVVIDQRGSKLYYLSHDGTPISGVVTLMLQDDRIAGSPLQVCPATLGALPAPAEAHTSVYPNPVAAGGVVHLSGRAGSTAALPAGEDPSAPYETYRLLDVQGRMQRSGSAYELQKGLAMPTLPGTYLLILEGKNGKTAAQIVVSD